MRFPTRFTIQETASGPTVFDSEAGECYKSRHSAFREAEEVFFRPAYLESPWREKAAPFRILELGFGLGTNFLHLNGKPGLAIEFVSIERDMTGAEFYLAHGEQAELRAILREKIFRREDFSASVIEKDFFTALPDLLARGQKFHAVYFDPFSPKANPEAWTTELFRLSHALLVPAGRLVTYSVSRAAKDAAAAAGFAVTKRELPPELQKRNSLLAVKP